MLGPGIGSSGCFDDSTKTSAWRSTGSSARVSRVSRLIQRDILDPVKRKCGLHRDGMGRIAFDREHAAAPSHEPGRIHGMEAEEAADAGNHRQ